MTYKESYKPKITLVVLTHHSDLLSPMAGTTPYRPVREARFPIRLTSRLRMAACITDELVLDLLYLTCSMTQPDFEAAHRDGNLVLRIPTPVFGGGLVEAIRDAEISNNVISNFVALSAQEQQDLVHFLVHSRRGGPHRKEKSS